MESAFYKIKASEQRVYPPGFIELLSTYETSNGYSIASFHLNSHTQGLPLQHKKQYRMEFLDIFHLNGYPPNFLKIRTIFYTRLYHVEENTANQSTRK